MGRLQALVPSVCGVTVVLAVLSAFCSAAFGQTVEVYGGSGRISGLDFRFLGEIVASPLSGMSVGDSTVWELTGSDQGTVWGSVVYTADSDLATAAVHAGLLEVGQSGKVKVTLLPGRDDYESSTRHGVTTRSYGSWSQSFWLERPADVPAAPTFDARQFRGQVGHVETVRLTGRTGGTVWGTEVYTDDSDVASAAVHAGVLEDGQTADVKITILPGRSQYRGTENHGITTLTYGPWGGSFWVEAAP